MNDYSSIADMMGETENMEHIVDNVGHDDDTVTIDGVDWFFFNGTRASTIYVNGNSWIGLGSSSEHLLVCRRDAKMWHLYREESTLFGTYKVLKIRWEGYSQYNSTSDDVLLVYEWFFVETGDMFLNLIRPPSNSSYLGTTKVAGALNQTFTITAGQKMQLSFYAKDTEGMGYDTVYEILDLQPPFEYRYLMSDGSGKYYKTEHDRITVDAIDLGGFQFIRTGIIPDQDTKVEVSFRTSEFGDKALFGARTSNDEDMFSVFLRTSEKIMGQYGTEASDAEVDDYTDTDCTITLSKEGLFRNGVVISEHTAQEFTAPSELTIGTINTNGTLNTSYFVGRVYYARIWQGETLVRDFVPCVDEQSHPCLYDIENGVYYYNDGYGTFGYVDSEGKYDNATHLVEVAIDSLNADFFHKNGFTDFPSDAVVSRLTDPSLLYWQDSDTDLPKLRINIKAVPPPQVVYSKNNMMTDSSILGVERVEVVADDTSLFAFSFDGGETWKAYINNAWVALSEETSGIGRDTVNAIGTDAWSVVAETMQYMVRFTLFEGGSVERITVHYLNTEVD